MTEHSIAPLLKAEDVAKMLNMGKSTIYKLAAQRKIKCYLFDRSKRFAIEHVNEYKEKNLSEPAT